jgi:hypothetical protein
MTIHRRIRESEFTGRRGHKRLHGGSRMNDFNAEYSVVLFSAYVYVVAISRLQKALLVDGSMFKAQSVGNMRP